MKNKKVTMSVVLLLMAGIFWGCSRPAAVVNGKNIDEKTLDLYVNEKVRELKARNVAPDLKLLKKNVLDELISETLMLDDAQAKGIKVSDEELDREIKLMTERTGQDAFNKALKEKGLTSDAFKKRTREKMTMLRFIESLSKENTVTDQEMTDYYRNSPVPFIKPARVLMKLIEVDSEESAKQIIAELRAGKLDFDDTAKRLEKEKKAFITDYGWVNPDFFSPPLAKAAKDLNIGAYGGPYKGVKKYYLIRVKDREKESAAKFEEVRENIRETLLERKKMASVAHWLDRKKKASKITINLK